jgi:hypothetical protein
MNFLEASVIWLDSLGFFTILVPFILIYAIAYGLLERIKIWGKGNTSNYSAIFAFCLAFFTIFQMQLAEKMGHFLARIGLLFIIVIAVMIISGLVGVHTEYGRRIVKFLIIGYILYNIVDIFFEGRLWNWIIQEEAIPAVIGVVATIIVFFAIVAFVMREPKGQLTPTKDVPPTKPKEEIPKEPKKYTIGELEKEVLEDTRNKFPSMSESDLIKYSQERARELAALQQRQQ